MKSFFVLIISVCLGLVLSFSRVFEPTIKSRLVFVDTTETFSKIDKVLFKNLKIIKKKLHLVQYFKHSPTKIKTTGFWVDKSEVKQGDFYQFVGWNRLHQAIKGKFYSSSKEHGLSGKLNVAANGVSFSDALAYCQAQKADLPTEQEVRLIAGDRLYPWGDKFNAKPWVYYDPRLNATLEPMSFPSANTQEGVADFGSGVAEWNKGRYPKGKPAIFGGNAYSKPYELYALNAISRPAPKQYRSPYVGFRCVYSAQPKLKTPWGAKYNVVRILAKEITVNQHPNSKIIPILKYLSSFSLSQFKQLIPKVKSIGKLKVSYEISVQEYQHFLDSFLTKIAFYQHPQTPKNHSDIPLNWGFQQQHPKRAVVGVDFFSAYHFANWAKARLPNYNEMKQIYALSSKQQVSLTAENLQTYPEGSSRWHINGNVSEWTSTVDSSDKSSKMVVYGGSFLIDKQDADKVDFYRKIPALSKLLDVGFRIILP
jgi:formylglycine-generating enzyme required for sulfatase activity